MTRHSKVFVPVSEVSENSFSIYTAYSSKEKEWLLMEEKENVYVLSERELFELMQQYQAQVYYANNITPEEFLKAKSKTNPQTNE
jgi:thioredoxin-related protein